MYLLFVHRRVPAWRSCSVCDLGSHPDTLAARTCSRSNRTIPEAPRSSSGSGVHLYTSMSLSTSVRPYGRRQSRSNTSSR